MDKTMFENITLDEWEKVGEGGNAESFFHKKDDTKVLKLAKTTERAEGKIFEEAEVAKNAIDHGIKTPKILAFVKYDNRYGIIYERLLKKQSFGKLCHDNPDMIEEYAKIFAKELAELHKIKCDKTKIRSKKQQLIDRVAEVKNEKYKNIANAYINEMKDVDTMLHGDASLGNLLQVGEQYYWIDLGTMMYGDPAFDIAILYLSYTFFIKLKSIQELFHVTEKQAQLFYQKLFEEYSNITKQDKFDLEVRTKKIAVVVLIIMAYVEKFKSGRIIALLLFKHIAKKVIKNIKKLDK